MFVVRIIADEGRTDYKAFSRKQDGERRYHAALLRTGEAEVASAALFEVTGWIPARSATVQANLISRSVPSSDRKASTGDL